VADPQIAYLLLMLGAAALLIELLHPGMIVPGVIGGIALLLALYALSVLPVSFVGAALLILALAFFVAEAFVTSFGLLAAGGVVCLVLGSLMLFDTGESGPRVNLGLVLPLALVIGLLATVLASRVLKSRRTPSRTGADALIGTEGEVLAPLGPGGTVLVHGEYWSAVASAPLSRGVRVRVIGAWGRRLSVESLGSGTEKGTS
jgi:membrane-bound serine protease (ClpP class)